MTDTCNHTTDSGKSCGNAAQDDGYCWLDGHGPDDYDFDFGEFGREQLQRAADNARSAQAMARIAEVALRHERENE